MKNILPVMTALMLLAACETNRQDADDIKAQVKEDAKTAQSNVERHGSRVADNVRDSVKRTSMKLRQWWLTPLPEEMPPSVPPSYCYQVLQDIMCYRAPMPGMEHKLVGYQGDAALPPARSQTLALPSKQMNRSNTLMSGKARVEAARPVFRNMPQASEDSAHDIADVLPELGNEPLPDPALSPQL